MWNNLLQTMNDPLPGWAGALLLVIGSVLLCRQHLAIRRIKRIELARLNSWADRVDECIDRLDWTKRKQDSFLAANDRFTSPWWNRKAS